MKDTRAKRVHRVGYLLSRTRTNANVSQSELAKEMGVSKRTIQNWEDGTSIPNIIQLIELYDALGVNPISDLLCFLFPDLYMGIKEDDDIELIREAIKIRLDSMSDKELKEWFFVLNGEHGSSPYAVLQEMVANLHSPIGSRYGIAMMIKTNFEIAEKMNALNCKEHVMPDMLALNNAIFKGAEAYTKNLKGYVANGNVTN